MSKRKLKPYDAVPFTNSKGHVLNPGDAAIAVTCSTGSAGLVHGKYLGTRKSTSYYGRDSVSVLMEVVKSGQKFVHKETGENYDYNLEYKELPYAAYPRARYGSDEYKAQLAEYQAESQKRQEAVKERQKDYHWVKYTWLGTTNLQLNKIYPADIALKDVQL